MLNCFTKHHLVQLLELLGRKTPVQGQDVWVARDDKICGLNWYDEHDVWHRAILHQYDGRLWFLVDGEELEVDDAKLQALGILPRKQKTP